MLAYFTYGKIIIKVKEKIYIRYIKLETYNNESKISYNCKWKD